MNSTEARNNLIGSGTVRLGEYPDQRRPLIDPPELLPDAVEEMLRVTSPVLTFRRTVTAPAGLVAIVEQLPAVFGARAHAAAGL